MMTDPQEGTGTLYIDGPDGDEYAIPYTADWQPAEPAAGFMTGGWVIDFPEGIPGVFCEATLGPRWEQDLIDRAAEDYEGSLPTAEDADYLRACQREEGEGL